MKPYKTEVEIEVELEVLEDGNVIKARCPDAIDNKYTLEAIENVIYDEFEDVYALHISLSGYHYFEKQ